MNRRLFLGSLLAAFALDPEKLLWRPGAKLISIPKPPIVACVLNVGDVFTIAGRNVVNPRFPILERYIVTGIWVSPIETTYSLAKAKVPEFRPLVGPAVAVVARPVAILRSPHSST